MGSLLRASLYLVYTVLVCMLLVGRCHARVELLESGESKIGTPFAYVH